MVSFSTVILLFLNCDRLPLAPVPDSFSDSPFLDSNWSPEHCGLQTQSFTHSALHFVSIHIHHPGRSMVMVGLSAWDIQLLPRMCHGFWIPAWKSTMTTSLLWNWIPVLSPCVLCVVLSRHFPCSPKGTPHKTLSQELRSIFILLQDWPSAICRWPPGPKVEFTFRTIHLCKAYNSIDSSMCTELCNQHQNQFWNIFIKPPQTLFVLINSHFSHHSSPTPRQPLIYLFSLPISFLFIFILAHWISGWSPDSSFWSPVSSYSGFHLPSALFSPSFLNTHSLPLSPHPTLNTHNILAVLSVEELSGLELPKLCISQRKNWPLPGSLKITTKPLE